jgi:hypothetical protein
LIIQELHKLLRRLDRLNTQETALWEEYAALKGSLLADEPRGRREERRLREARGAARMWQPRLGTAADSTPPSLRAVPMWRPGSAYCPTAKRLS